jgi:uncharacterized membrane protein YqjE
MATQQRMDPRMKSSDGPLTETHQEPPVRDLLKQLAGDGSELMRNEIALAKLEMREMARELVVDSAKLGLAIGIALGGGLVLMAAAVIGLGHVLDGRFGLAALIVGVVMLLIGALLARGGITGLRDMPRKPEQTIDSLERGREWASHEIREFKDEVRS